MILEQFLYLEWFYDCDDLWFWSESELFVYVPVLNFMIMMIVSESESANFCMYLFKLGVVYNYVIWFDSSIFDMYVLIIFFWYVFNFKAFGWK